MLSFIALKGTHCCLLFLILQLGILTDAQFTVETTSAGCSFGSMLLLDATDTPLTIQSPTYPSLYQNNEDCSWMISAPDGAIKITVEHYDIEFSESCLYDGLHIYDGPSSDVACDLTLCGTFNTSEEYITSSNEALINFYSDSSVVGGGFVLTYQNVDGNISSTIPCHSGGSSQNSMCIPGSEIELFATSSVQEIMSPNFPEPYENNADCAWRIYAPMGVIKIEVMYELESSTACKYDALTITDDECNATLCGLSSYSEEYITSSGEALITFRTDSSDTYGGFVLTYSYVDTTVAPTIPCNGPVPSQPTAGRCPLDVVELYATSSPQSLQSPNYPNPTENNQDCAWLISAPQGLIKVTVQHYVIEPNGQDCNYDSLTIYDGSSTDTFCQLAICGESYEHEEYISTSNEVFITFHTDRSVAYDGFSVTYQYVDENPNPGFQCPELVTPGSHNNGCPGHGEVILNATSTPQTIESPNYPNQYDNEADCHWTITASSGVISIAVTYYDIEEGRDCRYDNLIIYDGDSPCEAMICGTSNVTQEYITSTNEAYINFITDSSDTRGGFSITYQQVDGDIAPTIPCVHSAPSSPTHGRCSSGPVLLDALSYPQIIQSPNYPNPADIDQDCTWEISAPMGAVNITVQHYDIEDAESCVYDSLMIFDGSSSASGSTCNVTLCGVSSWCEEYITASSEATIHYHTDNSVTNAGFILTYQYVDFDTAPNIPCPSSAPSPPPPLALTN